MTQLAAGTLVAGRYSIVRLLGRGSTKQVYLANDRLTGTQSALALLVPDGETDPTLAARFSREGKAASVLRSPYVVRVHDVGKLPNGIRYLAAEPVLGRGLDAALSNGRVRGDDAARWSAQVLSALSEAHSRGIFHRDVKPENVLLGPSPDGEIAKLTDFGLAKILDGALEGSFQLHTAQNVLLGTPEYMAPEQWQGGAIDGRTDVYATGVMLYEMLVGHPPYETRFLHAMCVAHLTEPPPTFPTDLDEASRKYEAIVMRAIAKPPAERFQSADAMRIALETAGGFRIPAHFDNSERALPLRAPRAELLSDVWPGAISVLATPNVILGREPTAHIHVQCLPPSDDNMLRARTVSRHHARIDWRGGKAFVTDLESRTGTKVADKPVTTEPAELRFGDRLSFGKYVEFRFEHAPAEPGELPKWAKLSRLDEFGGMQIWILVLTEAKISAAADSAIRVPAHLAAGDLLRLRAHEGGLSVLALGALEPSPLSDGQRLRLGGIEISVALDD